MDLVEELEVFVVFFYDKSKWNSNGFSQIPRISSGAASSQTGLLTSHLDSVLNCYLTTNETEINLLQLL